MGDEHFNVMVSSTYGDLKEHREAVRDAILRLRMFPDMMEHDSAVPGRGIVTNSLSKVDRADAYVLLISNYRCGQIIDDPELNPNCLSVTELEFDRAEKRGLPLCIFLMDENVAVSAADMRKERATEDKLTAFRTRAHHHSRISATFTSTENLKTLVLQTLGELRDELNQQAVSRTDRTLPAMQPARPLAVPTTAPSPPAFYAKPPYTPGHAFQGRADELKTLDDWARSGDPVMVVEAIGGMGKSMLTWQWVNYRASELGIALAGRFWYSFYERGADMRDFKVAVLSYMTGQTPETIVTRSEAEVTEELLTRLREKRWLLVLGGLERVLAAYHRSDAAQAQDDDIEGDTGLKDRKPTDCIRPADDDLLRLLPAAGPSKLLISSRLMPHVFEPFGPRVPNVAHVALHGLAPEDAEAMLRRADVKGDGVRMRRYLSDAFGCHPLLVGFVAGLIRHAPWAGMGFARWVDDARGGAAVNLADRSVTNRRNNILKLAFDALEPRARELLARMGMLANAVGLDVLEALNPARPDPPREVREPTPPDEGWDFEQYRLRDRLSNAKTRKGRADLERQIAEREQQCRREHEAARAAHAAYQSALTAWRESAELRHAARWLSETLADLETRGLLQWDRAAETFDLHPVVRGYAIGHLNVDSRAAAGQRVADHFAARAEPDYEKVTSVAEMTDRIQVVQALNLAGKCPQAWEALTFGMRRALMRMERHHELLALLRPLFPNGWSAPPSGVVDPGLVANDAAVALSNIGRRAEEDAQKLFSISDGAAKHGIGTALAIHVLNHSWILLGRNELVRGERALSLARAIAAAADDDAQVLWCDLFQVSCLHNRNALPEARRLWSDITGSPAWQGRNQEVEAQSLLHEAWLLHHEGALTEAHLRAGIDRTHALGHRFHERGLWRLLGTSRLASGQDASAIAAFEHAIQMARDVGLSDPSAEAQRGLALARGHLAEAETAAVSAERGTFGKDLAELWLALGQCDKARDHALRGYKSAWADGPPHCWHWDLERCRTVLRALGEPEPVLPPYDPAKIQPLPYEVEINRLLAEHAKKKRK